MLPALPESLFIKCQLLFSLLVCLVPPDMRLGYVKSEFTVDCKTSTDLLPSRFIPAGLSGTIHRKFAKNIRVKIK